MSFESTLPAATAELIPVAALKHYLQADAQPATEPARMSALLTTLNPTLAQDLRRFDARSALAPTLDLLVALAAAVRHAQRLRLHLHWQQRVLPLSVYPAERLLHCPLDMAWFGQLRLADLQVMHIEPAVLGAPGDAPGTPRAPAEQYAPLGPLLWELALRGAREELLPEVAGTAAYRVAPGADLDALPLTGTLAAAVQRLRRQNANLRDISHWPGFSRGRAMRLINALYLQSALIISRAHPAASAA